MNIEIIKATKKDSLDLSIMTGELLQEIMDKIIIKAFNFNQEETQKRAEELISYKSGVRVQLLTFKEIVGSGREN